jgi:hypothetical protein
MPRAGRRGGGEHSGGLDAAAANLPLDHPFAQFLRISHRSASFQ